MEQPVFNHQKAWANIFSMKIKDPKSKYSVISLVNFF